MAKGKKKDLKPVGGGDLEHDNSRNELTDEQRQVLFFQHKRKIGDLKDKIASLTGDLRNVYKLAKAEGFPKKDFDFAFMLEKDEDDEAINRRRREAKIARWVQHPIGTQADLFEATDDTRSQQERGYDEGKRAGLANEVCKPPYGAGTDGYDGYMKGWHEGAAVRENMAAEQEEGESILMRSPENEPAGGDAFDAASGGGEEEPWPDDVQAEVSKQAEPV